MRTLKGKGMRWGFRARLLLVSLVLLLAWSATSCGGEKEKARRDPCTLLTQDEIDSLFSAPVGPGRSGATTPTIPECIWPDQGVPKFILQILPFSSGDVAKSIDPGEGYRVLRIEGLSGKAAVAIQEANPKYGITEGVAILAIQTGDVTLTFSPVGLDIQEDSPKFELLKKLADKAAGRI